MRDFVKTILSKERIIKKLSQPEKSVHITVIPKQVLLAYLTYMLFSATLCLLIVIIDPKLWLHALVIFVMSPFFPGSLFLFLIETEIVHDIDVIRYLFKNHDVSFKAYWQLKELLNFPKFSKLPPETLAKIRTEAFSYWYDILTKTPRWELLEDEKTLKELLEPLAKRIKELIEEDTNKLEQMRKCFVKTVKTKLTDQDKQD